jgi:hypothetical protein
MDRLKELEFALLNRSLDLLEKAYEHQLNGEGALMREALNEARENRIQVNRLTSLIEQVELLQIELRDILSKI